MALVRRLGLFVLLLAACNGPRLFAEAQIGDPAPARCWKDANSQSVCLGDYRGQVTVLVYTVGWCDPAQAFMEELSTRVQEFQNLPVVFLNLSASGWQSSSLPTARFLREWQASFAIPFPVLASPRDPGRDYFDQPLVPSAVILDSDHTVRFKQIAPDMGELMEEVHRLLPKS